MQDNYNTNKNDNDNNNNNNNNNNDNNDTISNEKLKTWKSNVISRVKQATMFTAFASGIFYSYDYYKAHRQHTALEPEVVQPQTYKRIPFHQSRLFRTLNFAANITTMSFVYFGIQQYLNVNHIRLLKPSSSLSPMKMITTPTTNVTTTKDASTTLSTEEGEENVNEPVVRHATSGFITGTLMYTLLNPGRITHSWRLGVLFALVASLGYKSYEQFVFWKIRRWIAMEEREQRAAAAANSNIQGEEEDVDATPSWSDQIYNKLPEWLKKEDEDTAQIRQRYDDIRLAREEMKRIAEWEQEQYDKERKNKERVV